MNFVRYRTAADSASRKFMPWRCRLGYHRWRNLMWEIMPSGHNRVFVDACTRPGCIAQRTRIEPVDSLSS